MNAPYSLDDADTAFVADLQALLAPLPDGDGVGVSLRAGPIYQRIRDARRHDDLSVPMGEWERPPIKADWKAVAELSADALRTHSKDFQVAAWYCEALTHLHGLDGFVTGMRLLSELVEHYWERAYPQLQDDDSDARAAPFIWIGRTLALVLRLHVPLMTLSEEPGSICLDDWLRLVSQPEDEDKAALLTREVLERDVTRGANLTQLERIERGAHAALDAAAGLGHCLDSRLGDDAPSFSSIANTLRDLRRAAHALRGNHAPVLACKGEDIMEDDLMAGNHGLEMTMWQGADGAGTPPMRVGAITDRAHAYRLLEEVARYLAEHEPHSPTPYLISRAVSWGSMSLPELMREIARTEGDFSRYMALLGAD